MSTNRALEEKTRAMIKYINTLSITPGDVLGMAVTDRSPLEVRFFGPAPSVAVKAWASQFPDDSVREIPARVPRISTNGGFADLNDRVTEAENLLRLLGRQDFGATNANVIEQLAEKVASMRSILAIVTPVREDDTDEHE